MSKIYKISLFCLILLMTAVVVTNVVKYVLTSEMDYTMALEVTTYDDIDSYGIFIREEHIVVNPTNEYVHIDVNNGSRVKKGQDIAITYKDKAYLDESIEISELRSKLAVIENVATITSTVSDSLKIAVQINENIAELNQSLDPNDLSSVSYILSEIESTALKSAYSQMSKTELSSMKEDIENEIANKQAEISSDMSTIQAEYTGSFVSTIDSYEYITNVSVDNIQDIVNEGVQNYADDYQIGKIITSNEWEFACVVDNEDVEAILKATKPRLVFESMPSNEISVTVSEVIKEEEQSVVVFTGKATNETLLEMRGSNVQIILRSYNGIKIPKQAAIVVDGNLGVYTLSGSQATFKPITPIFEKENYYVIEKITRAKSSDIIIGDRIVTNSSFFKTTNFIN